MSPCRRVLAWSLTGLLMLTTAQGMAADGGDPEALITRGLELREAGQDREALQLFQEAAAKTKAPRAIAQVGLCQYALGLWVEAEGNVQRALATRTDPWIRKNERTLKVALDEIQEKVGSLELWGEPAGARVAVDGRAVGTLPLERAVRLAAGRHSVLAEADGFLADNRFVEIRSRGVTREHLALAPVPVLKAVPPSTELSEKPLVGKGSADVTKTSAGGAAEPSSDTSSDPVYKRWWFWTAIGVVAVAATGTALLLTRKEPCDPAGAASCNIW